MYAGGVDDNGALVKSGNGGGLRVNTVVDVCSGEGSDIALGWVDGVLSLVADDGLLGFLSEVGGLLSGGAGSGLCYGAVVGVEVALELSDILSPAADGEVTGEGWGWLDFV